MKEYHKGVSERKQIDEQITGGKTLHGNLYQECTGITTIYRAGVDIIRGTTKRDVNLIIAHKASFWSHRDHVDWLQEKNNQSSLIKKKLLDEAGIIVWRGHDYTHSGVPMGDGGYTDDTLYGVADELGWMQYTIKGIHHPLYFTIPKTTVKELVDFLAQELQLNGVKIIGNKSSTVEKIGTPLHILGDARDFTQEADQENINRYLTMGVMDPTLAEYIRDSSMLGIDKTITGIGHSNLEESGMEYVITYLLTTVKADTPCTYIQPGDMHDYRTQQYRKHIQRLHE